MAGSEKVIYVAFKCDDDMHPLSVKEEQIVESNRKKQKR